MPSSIRKQVQKADSLYPPAPDGLVIYAIGDIHGRSDCLRAVHQRIDRDKRRLKAGKHTVEIYLGDYIDRGSDSYGVVEIILARARGTIIACLKGNHEIMLEAYLAGELSFEHWGPFGGLQALLSYNVDPLLLKHGGPALLAAAKSSIPELHKKFFALTHPYIRLGGYCFVHAGMRPRIPLKNQTLRDLTSIREGFLDYTGTFGCIVVHGHSPQPHVEFKPNRINLDTGAYATNRLSVIRIDENAPTLLID
jgi:serine/threonine protein phosphatase 1